MSASTTPAEFFALLKKSELLSDQAIAKFLKSFPGLSNEPEKAATAMVRQGLLTPYQAQLLLTGKYKGFHLGPYKLLEPIGQSESSTTFLADHSSLQRRVAIKVLPVEKANDKAALDRFYKEAQAAAALDHPNIVKLFDVNEGSGTHFIVMEYVQGQTLQKLLTSSGPIQYQKASQYITQAASGLRHAHQKGFVHRDIRPAKLMLSREGSIKILDMGLAHPIEDSGQSLQLDTNADSSRQAADYQAPELQSGGKADARSDIYSLGATLFALITGQPPFSSQQAALGVRPAVAPKLSQFRPDIPAPLTAIVARMMASQPEQRYQTADQVIQALQPWLPAEEPLPTLTRTSSALSGVIATPRRTSTAPIQPAVTQPVKPKPDNIKIADKPKGISPGIALAIVLSGIGVAVGALLFMMYSGDSTAALPTYSRIDLTNLSSGPPNQPQKPTKVPEKTKEPTGTTITTNYVSKNPRTDVNHDHCVFLSLNNVANVVSTKQLFMPDAKSNTTDTLSLPRYGNVVYHGVPFYVIDPKGKSVANVLVFKGGDSPFSQGRLQKATITCNHSAKTIHVLGGISGWAFPFNNDRSVSLIMRLRYADNSYEEHELMNGTHFADWRMPQGQVPTAPVVAQFDNERHLRYFSIKPAKSDEIADIELIKGKNEKTAPIFFAITVEKP